MNRHIYPLASVTLNGTFVPNVSSLMVEATARSGVVDCAIAQTNGRVTRLPAKWQIESLEKGRRLVAEGRGWKIELEVEADAL